MFSSDLTNYLTSVDIQKMQVLWVLVIVAFVGWLFVSRLKAARRRSAPQGIVLLLEAPRPLSTSQLADCFSSVTGRAFKEISQAEANEDANRARDFIITVSPSFLVNAAGTIYLINNVPKPYFDNVSKMAETTNELRLRQAIAKHTAWLSVEILHPEAVSPEAYRVVGKVIAHLIGRDCLALYYPPTKKLIACNLDQVSEQLRSEDPIASVFDNMPYIPVVLTGDNDKLREAEAEARKRFPEFEAAFKANSGSDFSVKALLTVDDESEHIWINVSEISGSILRGELGNEPVNLPGLRLGSPVEIDRARVEDWIYLNTSGVPTGMFTVGVLLKTSSK